jgi:hypothetical protein
MAIVSPVAASAAVGPAANAAVVSAPPTVTLPNPYGCYGKSGYPHISTHFPDRVSADGETTCLAGPQPFQYVESWLYRWDCFLIFCGWTLVGHDSSSKIVGKSVFDHPNHTCNGTSNHRYLIVSYHEVRGRDGKTYTGWTSNQRDVACG